MKDLIQLHKGYRGYSQIIEGFKFRVFEADKSNWIQFGAPMGDTKTDRAMFDTLVYNRKSIYQGSLDEKEKVVRRIRKFIKENV